MLTRAIAAWASVVMVAAVWTGAHPLPGGHYFFVSMTGLLPPHYGYSTYAISVLPFLAPWPWLRWTALAALLASGNRAAWVGTIAGWLCLGGRRRLLPALALCVLAVIGGLAMKPAVAARRNDSVRVQIWKASWSVAKRHPWAGVGHGNFAIGVEGRLVDYAHSDVLQFAVEDGIPAAAAFVLFAGLALWFLPLSPAKAALACLLAQSVVDNRLHHPACEILLAAVLLEAVRQFDHRATEP